MTEDHTTAAASAPARDLIAGSATGEAGRRALQRLFDAASAPGTAAELQGLQAMVDAFTALHPPVPQAVPDRIPATRRRTSMLPSLLTGKVALAAAGVVVVGASAAAAYSGSLPEPLQKLAHAHLSAPQASPTGDPEPSTTGARPTTSPTAKGPDATGPAAFGLCTAFTHGGLAKTSVAYRSLETAAGGADKITGFCAAVAKPSAAHATGSPSSHPTGSPSTHPTGSAPVTPPSGSPSTHPTGSPSTHPGKP